MPVESSRDWHTRSWVPSRSVWLPITRLDCYGIGTYLLGKIDHERPALAHYIVLMTVKVLYLGKLQQLGHQY